MTLATAYFQLIPSLDGSQSKIGEELGDEKKTGVDKAGKKTGETFGSAMLKAFAAIGAGKILAAGIEQGFESNFTTGKIAASLNLTAEQANMAGDVAGSLYADGFGESVGSLGESVEAVMSAFGKDLDAGALKQLTRDAENLATAFNIDVTEATSTAQTLIANGLAKDGTEAFDLLTTSMQNMPAGIREEVLPAMSEYSKSFAQLGISGGGAAALLAAASEQGVIGVDKMGDAIKEFTIRSTDMSASTLEAYAAITGLDLSTLDKESEEGQAALAALEAQARSWSNQILAGGETANGAMREIVDGLFTIEDPAAQAQASLALFGTPLEDLGTDQIPLFLDALDQSDREMFEVAGAAENLNAQLGKQISPLEEGKRAMMGMISSALQPVLPLLSGFAAWAKENPALLKAVSVALLAMGTALGIAAVAQWAMNSALLASPITWAIAGIAALVAGIVWLVQNWGTATEFLSACWDVIKTAASAAWNFVWGLISWVVNSVVSLFLNFTLPGLIIKHWDTITAATSAAWNAIITFFSAIPGKIVGFFSSLGSLFSDVFKGAANFATDAWSSAIAFFSELPGKIVGFFQSMGDGILAPFKTAFNAVAKAWNSTVGKLNWEVPSWVPGIGGKKVGAPQLPLLAEGGTATAPGWSIVGERGPEFLHLPRGASVVPLDHPQAANANPGSSSAQVDALLAMLVQLLNRPSVVKIGEREFFEIVRTVENKFGGR